MEFKILTENMNKALKTVERLRKIALKMNRVLNYETSECDPMIVTIHQSKVAIPRQLLTVTVNGANDILTYNNARFVARIDVTDNGAIVLTAPDYEGEIPQHYYSKPENRCDHCGHRRRRVRYYLVEKDGELMQVGSTCVKEFVGINPNHLMRTFEHLQIIESAGSVNDMLEGDMTPQPSRLSYEVAEVAQVSAGVITVDKGYAKHDTIATVKALLFPVTPQDYKLKQKYRDKGIDNIIDEFDFSDFVKFVQNMSPNNYTNNLKTVVDSTYVSYRGVGILVSGVYIYLKDKGTVGEKTVKKQCRLNEWVDASKGDRITFHGITVISTKEIQSLYGASTLYRMLDNKGRTIVWFSSNPIEALDKSYEQSTPIPHFTATIKCLDEYNGWKQTMVTRGKVN